MGHAAGSPGATVCLPVRVAVLPACRRAASCLSLLTCGDGGADDVGMGREQRWHGVAAVGVAVVERPALRRRQRFGWVLEGGKG